MMCDAMRMSCHHVPNLFCYISINLPASLIGDFMHRQRVSQMTDFGSKYQSHEQYHIHGGNVTHTSHIQIDLNLVSRHMSTVICLQDVSTMIRYRLNPVIFLINNGGYTIEVEIHDGPYNTIQGWDYSGLVRCFDNHQGNVFSTKVSHVTHSHCDRRLEVSAFVHDAIKCP